MSSVLTNNGAMVALQTMKSINKNLNGVQDMISTGKRVADSKDNAAVWAISTVMESDVSSFKAVGDSLALGQSTVAVARNASEQVTDLLNEMKSKIVAAQEENVDREKIQADITALRDQVKSVVGAAQFNGLSLLKGTDDVNILSSLDRSSNGSVATSSIAISRNNLDVTSAVAGTEVIESTTDVVATAQLNNDDTGTAATDGERTLTAFTNETTDLTFTTTQALDEGDTASFTFTGNSNTLTFAYEHTATGATTTTGEELAAELTSAYAAFKAGVDIGDGTNAGDYNATTGVYTASEGTFTISTTGDEDGLKSMTMVESSGTITVTNARDFDITFNAANEVDRVDSNIGSGGVAALADGATETFDISAATTGLQSDDEYDLVITAATNETLTINVTGASLSEDELADALFEALEGFKAGTANYSDGNSVTYAGANGNATVSFAFDDNGGALTEATFKDLFDGTTGDVNFQQTASGQFTIENQSGQAFNVAGTTTIGSSALTAANLSVNGNASGTNITIDAGTVGDYAEIDVGGSAVQAGDILSVTIEGVEDPITYTVTGDEADMDAVTEAFKDAINTALEDNNITSVVASIDSGEPTQIRLKNYDTTETVLVSDVSTKNELSDVATASGTTVAADATGTFTFSGRDVAEGDTYSITVGDTEVSYTATKNDDLNEVVSNLSGLLKLNTSDDIDVSFTSVDDPTSSDVVLSVTNNSDASLSTFSTTAKSGGTAAGGLALLDDIDVTEDLKAEGSLEIINNLIQTAIDASASFGSSEKRLEIQQDFIGKLTDSMKAGIGSMVDANMEETAAKLQALQVQQQLGTQALSIANQAPQNILALFR